MSGMASRTPMQQFAGAAAGKEWIGTDKKRADTLLVHRGERSVDLTRGAGIENQQLLPEAARSLTPFAFHARGFRKFRIDQQRDYCSIGNELVQQAQSLAGDQVTEPAHPGDIAAGPVEARDIALLDGVAAWFS